MPLLRVRDFHDDDLDHVVRVWEESRTPDGRAVHGLAEVMPAIREEGVAVVAVVGEVVVGAAVARISGDRAGSCCWPWQPTGTTAGWAARC